MNRNVVWQEVTVTPEVRSELLGQSGVVLWLTGLSGSGKSTIAKSLEKKLFEKGRLSFVLDGDNVRHGLCSDLGFSAEDRTENIRRFGETAKLFADAGLITIVSVISPFAADRDRAKNCIGAHRFIEVFVRASLEKCIERDPKGLYKKALNNEIPHFTGLTSPYDVPKTPDIMIDTESSSIENSVEEIMEFLLEHPSQRLRA